jgi:hypothetical protein
MLDRVQIAAVESEDVILLCGLLVVPAWTMTMLDDFREWKPDQWFDKGFLQLVPPPARKEFMRAVRPLSSTLHEQVHRALFAGIKQPFNYVGATGWMRRLLREGCDLPKTASFDERHDLMREKLPWLPEDLVLLVYHQPTTYTTTWGSFLKYFREDRIDTDTLLVCHPRSRETILFWEDCGPIFGKRGHRHLPCPRYDAEPDAPR